MNKQIPIKTQRKEAENCFFRSISLVLSFPQTTMTTSKRVADRKIARFQKNITRRGSESSSKKGNSYPVGPILLGFFVFVVVGSSLFQIIRTATSGGRA